MSRAAFAQQCLKLGERNPTTESRGFPSYSEVKPLRRADLRAARKVCPLTDGGLAEP